MFSTLWARAPISERAARLEAVAEVLLERADALALVMTREMGRKEGRGFKRTQNASGRTRARGVVCVCARARARDDLSASPEKGRVVIL